MLEVTWLNTTDHQYSDLSLRDKVPFEAAEQDFPLAGFQSIHHGWNRSGEVGH